jgi:hypothetical protein
MNKNQISQGAHAGALSTRNRQLFWGRFFLLALFLVLSLSSVQPKTSAQAADLSLRRDKVSLTSYSSKAFAKNCPQQCERVFVECLAQGGSNCGPQFDACYENCH